MEIRGRPKTDFPFSAENKNGRKISFFVGRKRKRVPFFGRKTKNKTKIIFLAEQWSDIKCPLKLPSPNNFRHYYLIPDTSYNVK